MQAIFRYSSLSPCIFVGYFISCIILSVFSLFCVLLMCLSIHLCVCLVDPDSTAAAVDPAGPGSDSSCSCSFSQPAEQHQRGQHLCFCSHTHYPATPVTAHPDCSCKCLLWLNLSTLVGSSNPCKRFGIVYDFREIVILKPLKR